MTSHAIPSATVPALPADFVARLSYLLTGRPLPEAGSPNTRTVEYTVGEEDDGYYD